MNIILSVLTAFFSFYIWAKYRPTGKRARLHLALCLYLSVLMLTTVSVFGGLPGVLTALADIFVCAFLLLCYRRCALLQRLEAKRRARAKSIPRSPLPETRYARMRRVSFPMPAEKESAAGRFAA